jgi:regulator of protease activity HflC (stomatin/prohibitin superfamily)
MNTTAVLTSNREREVTVLNGWLMLVVAVVWLVATIAIFVYSLADAGQIGHPRWFWFVLSLLLLTAWVIGLVGFFALQPNEARVLVLFGEYRGTVRKSGFHWGNPFYSNGPHSAAAATGGESGTKGSSPHAAGRTAGKRRLGRNKISLRVRTLNGEKLKVNDKRGNPIEISAIVVWRVNDTAQAMFDVDDFESYVEMQSESALRHLASQYAYDQGEEDEVTLRSNVEDVSRSLRAELQERLAKSGVIVEEARLNHLAYAPEIAQAMLRRQQAEAVIAARQKIVHGAVSMVEMALRDLQEKDVIHLDDERKAAMVSNLLVVLCGESEATPVINTGTLYA